MTLITRTTLIITALVAALALASAALMSPAPAGAIVPPKDCKTIKVKGKRYQIKADQVRCSRARDYAERYLKTHLRPRNYKCYRYSGSKLVFRCVNTKASPDSTIWGYKR